MSIRNFVGDNKSQPDGRGPSLQMRCEAIPKSHSSQKSPFRQCPPGGGVTGGTPVLRGVRCNTQTGCAINSALPLASAPKHLYIRGSIGSPQDFVTCLCGLRQLNFLACTTENLRNRAFFAQFWIPDKIDPVARSSWVYSGIASMVFPWENIIDFASRRLPFFLTSSSRTFIFLTTI